MTQGKGVDVLDLEEKFNGEDPFCYFVHDVNQRTDCTDKGVSNKSYYMSRFKKLFGELCPSVYHRYQLIKDLFKDKEYKRIGATLGVLGYPSKYWSALKTLQQT